MILLILSLKLKIENKLTIKIITKWQLQVQQLRI